MRKSKYGLAAVACAALLVAGCTENRNSIFRTTDLTATSIVRDAKQSIVLSVPAKGTLGRNEPTRIICAEPSPDVAQAMSDAFAAAVKADVKGQGGGSLDFSRSSAASVAQLGERLGTIQLLRDGLYRACEAYANGAISDVTYALIIGGIDKTMVTLLSAELAAGAFGRPLAVLGGQAFGLAGVTAEEAKELKAKLDVAEKELKTAQIEARKLESIRKKAKGDLDTAEKATPEAPAKTATAKTKLTEAEAELEKQNAVVDEKQLAVDLARKAYLSARGAAVTSAQAAAAMSGGIAGTRDRNAAKSVENIHRNALKSDTLSALMIACVTALDRPQTPGVSAPRRSEAAGRSLLTDLCNSQLPGWIKAMNEAKADQHESEMKRAEYRHKEKMKLLEGCHKHSDDGERQKCVDKVVASYR